MGKSSCGLGSTAWASNKHWLELDNEEYAVYTFQITGLKFLPEYWIPLLENPNAITNQHCIEDHSLNF